MHAPVQAPSQHTPCAQKPVEHSLPAAHAAPGGLSPHEPFVHKPPGTHSALVLHAPKQVSPLHA